MHPLDPERVERELRDNTLELVLFDPAPAETASLSLDLRRRFAVLTTEESILTGTDSGQTRPKCRNRTSGERK